MNHPNIYLLFNLLRHWKNILQNYIPQRNLIFPVVWKCIISRDVVMCKIKYLNK